MHALTCGTCSTGPGREFRALAAVAGTADAMASASPTLLWNDSTRRNRSSTAARMSPACTAASRAPRTASEPVASVVSAA
ncbi:hypothetical protein AB0D30_41015 [Streptomyces sp. NPDC048409]|uniref:hypothetical protein n=1 Tax=Streptomyces sp. NPDC048409 TaxID=3154723 RepID=UPI0034265000